MRVNVHQSNSSYKSILKATTLFASVKIVTILVNLVKNKVVAILLGSSGLGLLGIFTSAVTLVNSISDLGLSKSSVRNISASYTTNDSRYVSTTVFIFRRLLYILSIISAGLTLLFSKELSKISFGSNEYQWSFAWLSIAVLLNSISTGQLAILQGMRQLKALAKASTIGAVLGLVLSIPLFYVFGEKGIIPSLVVSGFIALILSTLFLKKIRFLPVTISITEILEEGKDMIKLGIAMMLVSLMSASAGFILKAYINNQAGMQDVGLFQAGFTIITGYFGMIFTTMSIDYFPRLSAINTDNSKIEIEVNQQSIIALILLCPLVVLLLFIMPFVMTLLYSSQFIEASKYVNWAIFGVVFQIGVQTMEMILLAKNRSSVFIWYVLLFQIIFLGNYIIFYNKFGVEGLGIAFSLSMMINLFAIRIVIKRLFNIRFNKKFYQTLGILIVFAILSFTLKDINVILVRIICAVFLLLASSFYSTYTLKKVLGIASIRSLIKNKITR